MGNYFEFNSLTHSHNAIFCCCRCSKPTPTLKSMVFVYNKEFSVALQFKTLKLPNSCHVFHFHHHSCLNFQLVQSKELLSLIVHSFCTIYSCSIGIGHLFVAASHTLHQKNGHIHGTHIPSFCILCNLNVPDCKTWDRISRKLATRAGL